MSRKQLIHATEHRGMNPALARHRGTPILEKSNSTSSSTTARVHARHPVLCKATWDFFTGTGGAKPGYIFDLSKGGLLLKTSDPIDHRRWVRIVLRDTSLNVNFAMVGRAVRAENRLEAVGDFDITLYRYGIQFTHPNYLMTPSGQDLILALSSRNLRVASCLSLNSKSSLRPGFLA